MNILTVSDARKRYGAVQALNGASFELRKGELLALLGPNGAGKTTLIRAIAGRVRLDGGEIRVFDQPVAGGRTPRELGIVPQELAIYPLLTARENLEAFGRLQGLSRRGAAPSRSTGRSSAPASRDRADEPVKQFSGGMKRRLNIACGMLHHPRIVLLDEPTVGVDPQSRERIYDMLAELTADGRVAAAHDPSSRRSRGALRAHRDHRSRQGDRRRHAGGAGRSDGRPPPPGDAPSRRAARSGVRCRGCDVEADPAEPRQLRARMTDVATDLPPLLDGDPRRRRASVDDVDVRGPEPAGGVHSSDRKGAAGMMLDAAAHRLDQPQARSGGADADVRAADRLLLDLRQRVRQPAATRTRRASAIAVVDEDGSELSRARSSTALRQGDRRCACGRGGRRARPRSIAPRAERLVRERRRAGRRGHPERAGRRRSARAASRQLGTAGRSCSPIRPIRSRRRWCRGCCRR